MKNLIIDKPEDPLTYLAEKVMEPECNLFKMFLMFRQPNFHCGRSWFERARAVSINQRLPRLHLHVGRWSVKERN
jgi:hypothetical protein